MMLQWEGEADYWPEKVCRGAYGCHLLLLQLRDHNGGFRQTISSLTFREGEQLVSPAGGPGYPSPSYYFPPILLMEDLAAERTNQLSSSVALVKASRAVASPRIPRA